MGSAVVLDMCNMKVAVFLFPLLSLSLPSPDTPGYGSPAPSYPDEPAKYTFQYGVKDDYTSNNFGQSENRDGYSAQGEYFVNLPDGRLQKVTYSVNGEGGYVADVSYTGGAQYPPEPAGGYGHTNKI